MRGGRFTTTEKRLELLRKVKKRKKKEKNRFFLKEAAFPVRPYFYHIFLSSVVSQKSILFHIRSQNLWSMGKIFLKEASKHKKQKSIFEISIFPRFVIDFRQISITIDGVPVNARYNDKIAESETKLSP